jgi:hypothetical protein
VGGGVSDLATRIEAAYIALERLPDGRPRESARGARAWFARLAYSDATTVSRWLAAGELPGPARGLLEQLETRAQFAP